MSFRSALLAAALLGAAASSRPAAAQADSTRARADSVRADSARATDSTKAPPRSKPWYERISLRGYAQFRYNQILETNPNYECAQCDRSLGGTGGFFLRRARLVFSGDVNDRISFYLQPDFASEVSGNLHFLQLRDAYFDVAIDSAKAWRVRVGQSKIPYGWENMQSSSVRIALDRTDAINSALVNERDIGVLVYWAPPHIRARLKTLADSGLKGSGDYGVVGTGIFNGQGTNRPEANNDLHGVLRVGYPFLLPNGQYVEAAVQGYGGQYTLPQTLRTPGLIVPQETYADYRVGTTLVVYPQPFGLQTEWNWGRGPEFDPATSTVLEQRLNGGYVQVMVRMTPGRQVIIPYARAQRYDGGKKFENDARSYFVRELVAGAEWTLIPAFELTLEYLTGTRRFEDLSAPENQQRGQTMRVQAQFSF